MDDDPSLDHSSKLWVSPVDDENLSVNPLFIEAALQHEANFMSYRARELHDEPLARELVEKAVHAASRARNGKPVKDAAAYLFRTFMRIVDAEIEKSRRFLPLRDTTIYGSQPTVEEGFLVQEVLDSLDEESRRIIWKRFWGMRVDDLAKQAGITPDAMSQRLHRIRGEFEKRLDGNGTEAPLSGPSAKRRGPTRAGGLVPRDGKGRAA